MTSELLGAWHFTRWTGQYETVCIFCSPRYVISDPAVINTITVAKLILGIETLSAPRAGRPACLRERYREAFTEMKRSCWCDYLSILIDCMRRVEAHF